MPSPRRLASAPSKTRDAVIDAAEWVMVEQGYAAVTSRRVAGRAGIHPGNLHYYFPTLDELFIALLDRGAARSREQVAAALRSPRPLRALWRLSADRKRVVLLNELMSAANHRKALRARVAELAVEDMRMQVEALRELVPEYDLAEGRFPAELIAVVVQGTGLLVARQRELGVADEHATAEKAIEALIDALEAVRDRNPPPA